MKKGYITVFFTIAVAISMSLVITMLYSLRSSAVRMKAVCAMDVALTSVFAEYNRALWDQYGLIFVDAGYMTKVSGLALSEEHLKNCINKNFEECELGLLGGKDLLKLECDEAEATAVCLASDDNGAAIKLQAVNLMKYHYKLAYVEEAKELLDKIEAYGLSEGVSYEEAYDAAGVLNSKYKIDYSGWLPSVTGGNDISEDTVSHFSILYKVTDGDFSVTKINNDLYAAKRKLNAGNLSKEVNSGAADYFFFREYLMKYCGNYQNVKDTGVLAYQAEYLCSGKDSDCDNLASVARRILVIREAANLSTLTSDEGKMAMIEAFCIGVCTLIGFPEAADILKPVIIAWWVNHESLTDVKIIMGGGKIPLIKDSSQWITGFKTLFSNIKDPSQYREGIGYKDYLKVFIYLTGEKKLKKRFMSLAEMDVRKVEGNEYFRMDNCFDEWQVNICISSDHGYDFTAVRRKRVLN